METAQEMEVRPYYVEVRNADRYGRVDESGSRFVVNAVSAASAVQFKAREAAYARNWPGGFRLDLLPSIGEDAAKAQIAPYGDAPVESVLIGYRKLD